MSEEFDLSGAIEQVQQMLATEEGESQIQNLLGMLAGGGNSNTGDEVQNSADSAAASSQENLFSSIPDVETIMKIKNLMGLMGNRENDANAAFLNSLKPFLKKDRQKKLEQAAKLMSVAKAVKLFKDAGLGGV